jgi:hypothetical protein
MLTTEQRAAKLESARALRRKAASTTSEAEAMNCIALMRKLQKSCGLTLDEIEADGAAVSSEHFTKATMQSGSGHWNHVDMNMAFDIAEFCHVKVGTIYPIVNNVKEYHLAFFGYEADVDNATWLRETIKAAMLWEWEVYRDFSMPPGTYQSTARRVFSRNMAARLRERMQREKDADDAATTALTLRVNSLVAQRAKEVGFVEAKASYRTTTDRNDHAAMAGRMAGDRVDMGRGVTHRGAGSATAVPRIGK